ncbi:hypothetical protein PsorP6_014684 [Peronosclerospora sorghi]|uniref:Uncharacterized protein n=1 Tax=Peronosclerospora sorghi TaxID=230839 RepID=A0ACC0VUH1_9STRA|nr:hypothetical protein PsorP6_014684 [Peronosclerospora sorghi]
MGRGGGETAGSGDSDTTRPAEVDDSKVLGMFAYCGLSPDNCRISFSSDFLPAQCVQILTGPV